MKTLVKLSAILTVAPASAPRPATIALHHEVAPGTFLHVGLGPGGLLIFRGDLAVAVPLDELVKLALNHEPALGAMAVVSPPSPGAAGESSAKVPVLSGRGEGGNNRH